MPRFGHQTHLVSPTSLLKHLQDGFNVVVLSYQAGLSLVFTHLCTAMTLTCTQLSFEPFDLSIGSWAIELRSFHIPHFESQGLASLRREWTGPAAPALAGGAKDGGRRPGHR